MAESLADKASNERDKLALTVITERCMHLQSFVERYSSLSKGLILRYQNIVIVDFFAPILALYNSDLDSQFSISLHVGVEKVVADNSFLAQVFINILKNAKEAGANQVNIETSIQAKNYQSSRPHNSAATVLIEVTDNGHGFSNLSNLFVPLYSTKEQGQGIGLSFCRNIIEQHKGSITLVNNSSFKKGQKGVKVSIYLPITNSLS